MGAMGVRTRPRCTRTCSCAASTTTTVASYAEMYEWLAPGELLAEAPESWAADWSRADPDSFN